MNAENLIWGLIAILLGLIGVLIESGKSWRENKERGWDLTRTKLVIGTWTLIIVGTILTIMALFVNE